MRFIAFIVLLFSTITYSQNCDNTLTGTVKDLHDGSMLFGAILIVAGTEQAVETDLEGNYTFKNLCNETYFIQVSHPYCLTKGFKVTVSGTTVKHFKLEHHLEELNQVTLQGKAYSDKSKTINETRITAKSLEQFSSGSLGDALNSISGVASLNTGNTIVKPIINGLHSSRITIINNGVRMEDQEWGAEHAPNIDANAIGNLTVIKGAGALQYSGDAIGGVIVAEAPKVPVVDSLYGKTLLTSATNGSGFSLTSQLTKSFISGWYAAAQGTLKRFGDYEAPNYILSNTGNNLRSASFHIGYNQFNYGVEAYYSHFKNEIGILRASHLGGAQDLIRALNSNVPLIINDFTYSINYPKQEVTHNLVHVKGFKRWEGFGKLSVQYNYQKNCRLEYDIRRGDDFNKAALDLQLSTHSLLADVTSNLNEKIALKYGLSGKFHNNFANPETGVRRLIPDYDAYDFGLYTVVDYRLNEKWILEAGARFDYTYIDAFKYYKTSFWEMRNYDQLFPDIVVEELSTQVLTHPQLHFYNGATTFGATYSFANQFKLLFNYALASRAPNPAELFSDGLHHSASRFEIGDLRFISEIGHKFTFTLKKESKRFPFAIHPYFHAISNFITLEPTGTQQTIRGFFPVWEYRQTNAYLLGIDFDASIKLSKNLQYTNQFALVKGYDKRKNEPLINMPAANLKNELAYQNTAFYNLKLALESDYYFKQNEYPNTDFEVYIPETETTETATISTPPKAYNLFNFNSSIAFKATKQATIQIGFAIKNITNKTYQNYLNRMRYYADDLGRNFLFTIKMNY